MTARRAGRLVRLYSPCRLTELRRAYLRHPVTIRAANSGTPDDARPDAPPTWQSADQASPPAQVNSHTPRLSGSGAAATSIQSRASFPDTPCS